MENSESTTDKTYFDPPVEETIASLSRQAHGGQQISFIESEHAPDMIIVHADSSAATILFGAGQFHQQHGVDLIFQQDGEERYAFITRESYESVHCHLVETGLFDDRSHAWQMAHMRENATHIRPRGCIIHQTKFRSRLSGWRFSIARALQRPTYVAVEMVDGSTMYERW